MNTDNKPFWTDDTIREYAELYHQECETNLAKIKRQDYEIHFTSPDDFKQSKVKEAPLPEKIEVTLAKGFITDMNDNWTAHLYSTKPISEDKFPAIKEAVEAVLNGKEEDKCVFDADRINERIKHIEELEEAFNSGRLTHPMVGFKFDTFQDYCKSKQPEWLNEFSKSKSHETLTPTEPQGKEVTDNSNVACLSSNDALSAWSSSLINFRNNISTISKQKLKQ